MSREVSPDVVPNKTVPNERARKVFAGFTVTGKLERSDFGMKYGLAFIGDKIDPHLEVLAARPM